MPNKKISRKSRRHFGRKHNKGITYSPEQAWAVGMSKAGVGRDFKGPG